MHYQRPCTTLNDSGYVEPANKSAATLVFTSHAELQEGRSVIKKEQVIFWTEKFRQEMAIKRVTL